MKNQKGFTLVEIVVAVGIMGIVTYAGVSAYQYFMGQSKKELKKLDNISEFTLFAKDVAKLAEGAGISTYYLNFPITKSCGQASQGSIATTPCLQTLDSKEVFHPITSTDLPSNLNNPNNLCIQFYRDAFGSLKRKKAFPGDNSRKEDLLHNEAFTYDFDKSVYATWPLVDESSKPFVVMKRRSDGLVLRTMDAPFSASNPSSQYAFFKAQGELNISQLEGYPFLIYGSLFVDQFMIHVAEDIVSCHENRAFCDSQAQTYNSCMKLAGGPALNCPNPALAPVIATENLYAIKFRPLNEVKRNQFFNGLSLNTLPANCSESWDNVRQANFYLFPTSTMSIQPPLDGGATGWDDSHITSFMNVKGQAHFYGFWNTSEIDEGLMTAVPIDIVSYYIAISGTAPNLQKDLMAKIYSEIQAVNPREKIRNLKAPFYFARKLGTQELSIWYNPK